MSSQTNKICSIKTKRKLKKQKTSAVTWLFLKYPALDVAVKIPTSKQWHITNSEDIMFLLKKLTTLL